MGVIHQDSTLPYRVTGAEGCFLFETEAAPIIMGTDMCQNLRLLLYHDVEGPKLYNFRGLATFFSGFGEWCSQFLPLKGLHFKPKYMLYWVLAQHILGLVRKSPYLSQICTLGADALLPLSQPGQKTEIGSLASVDSQSCKVQIKKFGWTIS